MNPVADRFVAVLDANVLFPFRKRDALLSFYDAGLFRARWTDAILDEWTRNLLARRPDLESSVRSQEKVMRAHFPEARVTGYEPLIDAVVLPDPDDRHVVAAAIRCGAQHIVTENLADFPARALAALDVEAIGADAFLTGCFDLYPADALVALQRLRRRYRNPPFTPSGFISDLAAKGMPKLAAMLREHRELL